MGYLLSQCGVHNTSTCAIGNSWETPHVNVLHCYLVGGLRSSSTSHQFDVPVVRICRTAGTSNYWESQQFDVPKVRRPNSSTNVELMGLESQQFDICNTQFIIRKLDFSVCLKAKGMKKLFSYNLKNCRRLYGLLLLFYYDKIEKQITLIYAIKTT